MAALSSTRDSNMATMTSCKRKLYEAQQRELDNSKENATKRDNRKACKNKENRTNFFSFLISLTNWEETKHEGHYLHKNEVQCPKIGLENQYGRHFFVSRL